MTTTTTDKNEYANQTICNKNYNNEYANNTVYITIFSPPDDRFAVSPSAVITEPGTRRFCEFRKAPEKV